MTHQQGAAWKLVPVEPTWPMLAAGAHCLTTRSNSLASAVYDAMLAAAPASPVAGRRVAWMRGVHQPSSPNGPAEWDAEFVYGDDQPAGNGWLPLYRAAGQGEITTTHPVILNGDHAAFEREHSSTPPKERSDWPLPSFDAKDWAEAFCRRFMIMHRAGYDTKPIDDDVGLMITWFASALMRGFDEHAARASSLPPQPSRDDVLEEAAKVAGYASIGLSPGPLYTAGFRDCQDHVADRIRALKSHTPQSTGTGS